MKSKIFYLISFFSFFWLSSLQAEVISVTSKSGKKMIITLLARQGEKVVMRRASDDKEFTISPDSLDEKSAKLIRSKMKNLKIALPPLDAQVVISKRRKKKANSFYMKQMEVGSKITIINEDPKIPCPPCTANMVFIGQDQEDTDQFTVLANQQFKVTPTRQGAIQNTSPFTTTYDSYNKGEGNIGGAKYVGYLLVITSPDKEIIYTKTMHSGIKKALEFDASAAAKIKKYPSGTILGPDMKKPKKAKRNNGILKL